MREVFADRTANRSKIDSHATIGKNKSSNNRMNRVKIIASRDFSCSGVPDGRRTPIDGSDGSQIYPPFD